MTLRNRTKIFVLAIVLAATSANAAPGMPLAYRSMAFPRPTGLESYMIDEGHALGFNDVCLHTEYSHQRRQIIAARQHLVDTGALEKIEKYGMSISLWTREWVDIDESWGEPSVDNPLVWEKVSQRYDEILDVLFPEVDYIVFVTAETKIPLDEKSWFRMVNLVNEKCRSRGKRMILRNFSHSPKELLQWPEREAKLDRDIIIQTKDVPIDWSLRARPNPLIGRSPNHREFVEFDAGGEYFRRDSMIVGAADLHEIPYAYAEARGMDGVSIRVERYKHHIFRHPNFINIYHLIGRAMGRFANADEAWSSFARDYYGPDIPEEMVNILRPTGEVFCESIYILDDIFGNSARDYLGGWTGVPKIATPYAWSYSPRNYAKALYPDYDDSHFAKIDAGAPEIIELKEQAVGEAFTSIDNSLSQLETLRDALGPEGFVLHRWLLEETRFHLRLMSQACYAWLKERQIQSGADAASTARLNDEIDAHLAAIAAMIPETQATIDVNWRDRRHRYQRGEYYDIPRLLADFAAWRTQPDPQTLYQSKPLTGPIGTIKLEGPAADRSGGLFFCNAQQEGLEFTWKSSNRGNIAYANQDGRVRVIATLDPGQRGNGARLGPDGQLYIADQLGGAILRIDPETGKRESYFTFPDGSGNPNDLAFRSDGTLYVSFFNDGLWMIAPDGASGSKVGNGFHNGIDLSPDETQLYSAEKTYDVTANGSLSNPRPLLQLPPETDGFSYTDGIRVDARGNIYLARFGGRTVPSDKKSPRLNGVVHQFAPDGQLLRNIPMPDPNVTNLTFGGYDGRTVFVTHPGPKGFISSFRSEYAGREFQWPSLATNSLQTNR